MTQKESNPFRYSDTNKRYHTYDYYLRKTFGEKVAKLPLDAGFSCPNIDGTCGRGGCIYCSGRGSGDFAQMPTQSIPEQIRKQKEIFSRKWPVNKCIAYFQAHTNTYAPVDVLRKKYEEALADESIVGLNIATRADCLSADVLELLAEFAEKTVLTVELGLQSSSDATAEKIRRGHTFARFCRGFSSLRQASPKIRIGVHVIFGLPDEGDEEMMQTVKDVASLKPDEVKIHLLHVLKHTALAEWFENGTYEPLTKEKYVRTAADALELLPPETVVGRLTGDGSREDLLAPLWSLKKVSVINDIDKLLFERNSYQGIKYEN